MVEGYYLQGSAGDTYIAVVTDIPFADFDFVPVDPSTVGRCSGAQDKNGNLIFDGDILKTTNQNCEVWYVDYKLTAFCANQGNCNYSRVLDDFMRTSEVEVIGSVHDNPELRGGGQDG